MIILKHLDSERILISNSQSVLLYNTTTDSALDIKLPSTNLQKGNENITAITTSKCGSYFALLRNKQVLIYDKSLNIVKEYVLKRSAHSINLFGGYNMLVADKTGDVYLYKMNESEDKDGLLLFGHLSMLLDVVLSDDEKFLITCDRDEKIRVSHYPNTYNIQKFCLGHKEFVTKVVLLNSCLLSASGDGQIILWEYMKGSILHTINTNDNVTDKTTLNNFIETLSENKSEASCLPIIDIQVQKFDTIYYLIVQIYKLKSLQIYSLNFTNGIESKFLEDLCFSSEIQTFSFNKELFVSTIDCIKMFTLSQNKFIEVHKDFLETIKITNAYDNNWDIITLYKRKFDNVEEYLERKRQRMEAK